MLNDLLLLFLTLILSFALYPVWVWFVYKFHLREEVRGDGPKAHLAKRGTPTMGGMVFIFSVAAVTIMLNRSRTQTLLPVFVATLAGIFGLLEDLTKVYKKSGLSGGLSRHLEHASTDADTNADLKKRGFVLWRVFKEFWRVVGSSPDSGIQTHQKFIIQGTIAGFVSYWTYFKLGWDYLWFPLVGHVHIGYLYPIFIFAFIIIVLNSVAFTDGLDGLAGGLSLIALLAFWPIASFLGYNNLAAFCATFVGALIPFLYFNIYPSRIFMGNIGSHVLGATMAILAVVLHREIAFLLIGIVFLADGFSSPLQQLSVKLTGKRIFRMAPLHHHFELLGWPETKVTLRFWLIGIAFAFFGVFTALL